MIIYTIYKSTNTINGKVYIGFASDYDRRLSEHKSHSETLKYKFYNAIRKYGWDNFQWEIIYQSTDQEYTLKIMEPYFINEYDSYYKGYNSTKGGEGNLGLIHSEESKRKMSESSKGQKAWNKGIKCDPLSEKHKQKLSDSLKGKTAWNKGIPNSEEQKKKISDSLKNNNPMDNPDNRKKVSKALKGRVFTDEWRKKLSESAKNRKRSNQSITK
jgi:group I intron endonuclease